MHVACTEFLTAMHTGGRSAGPRRHAVETGRTIVSRDAKTRFADLPGVYAVEV